MDPNANLREQLELARNLLALDAEKKRLRRLGKTSEFIEILRQGRRDAARLAELVEALDGWMTAGGALPTRWVAPWARP